MEKKIRYLIISTIIIIAIGFMLFIIIRSINDINNVVNDTNKGCIHYIENSKYNCLAMITKDASYCDNIVQTEVYFYENDTKENCISNVLFIDETLNSGQLDLEDCDKLDEKGGITCRSISKSDPSECELLKELGSKEEELICKALVSKDKKYCEMIISSANCPQIS